MSPKSPKRCTYFAECELNGDQYKRKLRACQRDALEAIAEHFRKPPPHKTGLVVLPTGTGKSLVMLLAPYVTKAVGKCIILTPRPSITRAVLSSRELLSRNKLLEEAIMPQVRI